jgi:hypothetical protein
MAIRKKQFLAAQSSRNTLQCLASEALFRLGTGNRWNRSRKSDDIFLVICVIPSDYQLINSFDYDRVLLRHVTNDHCSVDTPLLVTYVQGTTAGRWRLQFVPLFFRVQFNVLGFMSTGFIISQGSCPLGNGRMYCNGLLDAAIKQYSSYGYL